MAELTYDKKFTPASVGAMLGFFGVHIAALGAFFTGVSTTDIVVCVTLYWVRIFAIGAGYHRYFAHRSYKTGRVFQFIIGFLAQSTAQSGLIWWASKHRDHHRHSDTPKDMHSPRQYGFWFSHMGWIWNNQAQEANYDNVPDLTKYPELVWLDRQRFLPAVIMGLAVLALFGWSGLWFGFFFSTVLVYHSTFTINSLCHVWGKQRYLTGDDSRNNPVLAFLTMGEGWHNNHHYFMSSTRQGFRWYEWDPTYYILKMLSWVGIVWDLKQPPKHVLVGERKLSSELKDRVAEQLAASICVDTLAENVRARLNRSGIAVDEFKRNLAQRIERGRDALHQFELPELPELPSVEELRAKARQKYAESPSMDDIVLRARLMLGEAVTMRLATPAQG